MTKILVGMIYNKIELKNEVIHMYVIYLDVLILINLIMDMIIFIISTMIINKVVPFKKILIGSILASIMYCIFAITPLMRDVPAILYSVFIPLPAILIIFKPYNIKTLIKEYLVCTFVAALIGGITFSIWSRMGLRLESIWNINIWILLLIGAMVGCCFYLSFYHIRRRFILPEFEYNMVLVRNGIEVGLKSLLDTGNCLYTPMTHKPVVVAEYKCVDVLMTENEKKFCEKYADNIESILTDDIMQDIKYLIPFSSVGCKGGMLIGIEVDSMTIKKYDFRKKYRNCIIGVSITPISSDRSYTALLHPQYILGGIVDESVSIEKYVQI